MQSLLLSRDEVILVYFIFHHPLLPGQGKASQNPTHKQKVTQSYDEYYIITWYTLSFPFSTILAYFVPARNPFWSWMVSSPTLSSCCNSSSYRQSVSLLYFKVLGDKTTRMILFESELGASGPEGMWPLLVNTTKRGVGEQDCGWTIHTHNSYSLLMQR